MTETPCIEQGIRAAGFRESGSGADAVRPMENFRRQADASTMAVSKHAEPNDLRPWLYPARLGRRGALSQPLSESPVYDELDADDVEFVSDELVSDEDSVPSVPLCDGAVPYDADGAVPFGGEFDPPKEPLGGAPGAFPACALPVVLFPASAPPVPVDESDPLGDVEPLAPAEAVPWDVPDAFPDVVFPGAPLPFEAD